MLQHINLLGRDDEPTCHVGVGLFGRTPVHNAAIPEFVSVREPRRPLSAAAGTRDKGDASTSSRVFSLFFAPLAPDGRVVQLGVEAVKRAGLNDCGHASHTLPESGLVPSVDAEPFERRPRPDGCGTPRTPHSLQVSGLVHGVVGAPVCCAERLVQALGGDTGTPKRGVVVVAGRGVAVAARVGRRGRRGVGCRSRP